MQSLKHGKLILTFIIWSIVAFATQNLFAQVTIGSNVASNKGSLLDLKENDEINANASKGLMLPRVKLKAVSTLPPVNLDDPAVEHFSGDEIHIGLWVYNMTNNMGFYNRNSDEGLCEGPYYWSGEKWIRMFAKCPCEYAIKGWQDNKEYYILCDDFPDITQSEAVNTCKSVSSDKYTYHLMTYKEYEQIWAGPVLDAIPETSGFIPDEYYFVFKESEVKSPLGWITMGYEPSAGTKRRKVLALNQAYSKTLPEDGHFPGGTPIGGEWIDTGTVRCVRDY